MEWFKVYVRYPDDPAINRVGEAGEILFMRSLAYTADKDSDGFIPDWQIPKFGLPRIDARVKALVKHGLWTPVDGGWEVTNWRRLQAEVYAIEKRRRADALRKKAARGGDLSTDTSVDSPPDDPTDTTVDGPGNVHTNPSYISSKGVVGDLREEIPPNPPAEPGGRCAKHGDKPAPNCRGCGTNQRAVQAAADAPPPRPTWCGSCDETTRMLTAEAESSLDDVVVRCPDCHPLAAGVPA
jgi:hypothetical protein